MTTGPRDAGGSGPVSVSSTSDGPVTASHRIAAVASRRAIFDWVIAAALLAVACWLRAPGLGASSLWFDDAWLALVSRVHRFSDMRYVEALAPGFAWLLRGWFRLVGYSDGAAQALPFAAGAVLAPLAYLAASRMGMSRAAACFAGLLLAAAPEHATFSTRVKPYAFDALAAVLLAWAALAAMRSAATRASQALVAVSAAAALVFSSATAPVGSAAVLAVAFAHRRRSERTFAAAAMLAFVTFAAAWWWLVIHPRSAGNMLLRFWKDQMISGDSVGEWLSSAAGALAAMLSGMLVGPPMVWLAVLVAATAVAAIRCTDRFVLFAAPIAAAVLLSAAHVAPLGGGRTDIYLLVPVVLLIATAVEEMFRAIPAANAAAFAAVAVATVCVVSSPGSRPYPVEDSRPLIELVENRRAPDDLVLVYSAARYAYGLYGRSDFTLAAGPDGFAVDFADPAIRVLASHRKIPNWLRADVSRAVAAASSVWFVGTHFGEDVLLIDEALAAAGFDKEFYRERPNAMASYWRKKSGAGDVQADTPPAEQAAPVPAQ